jgi:hypothetical protein
MSSSDFSEWALGRAKTYLCGLHPPPTEEIMDEKAEDLLRAFPSSADMKGLLIGLAVDTIVESIPTGFDVDEVGLTPLFLPVVIILVYPDY